MVTFVDALNVGRELPFGSAVNEAVSWMKKYEITQLSVTNKTADSFSMNFSKEACKQTAARICVALALPMIATVGVLYNLAAGSVRFGLGVTASLKQVDRKEVSTEINAAMTHFSTAAYDFAVAYFLSMHVIGTFLAIASGLFPAQTLQGHDYFFANDVKENAEKVNVPDYYKLKDCLIQRTALKITESLVPADAKMGFGQRLSNLFTTKAAKA
jgi:hypothetical protein